MKFTRFVYRIRTHAPFIDYYASFERTWWWDVFKDRRRHIGHFNDLGEAKAFVQQRHPKWWAIELARTGGSLVDEMPSPTLEAEAVSAELEAKSAH